MSQLLKLARDIGEAREQFHSVLQRMRYKDVLMVKSYAAL